MDSLLAQVAQRQRAAGRRVRGLLARPRGAIRDCTVEVVLTDLHTGESYLVISNRFGSLEALGKGFRAELLALMLGGRTASTAVAPRHLGAWREFTGGAAELPADASAVEVWIDERLAGRASAST